MEYSSFTAEDFAMEASFRNYCLKTNPNDELFWEQWRQQNPGKEVAVQQGIQLVLLLSGSHTEAQLLQDRDHFRSSMTQHLDKHDQYPALRTRKNNKKYFLSAAAVIAALIAVTALVFINKKSPPGYQEPVYSHAGEKKSFLLPDNTKVTLNAGSTVKMAEDFNTKTREIILEGEAFFEVTHNAAKPFIIHTQLMDIKVLGTTFNVKSYAEDKIAETSLLEGSVEVTMKNTKKTIVLKPNEKLVLPRHIEKTNQVQKNVAETFNITHLTYDKTDSSLAEVSWTESRLVFNDQDFEELARTLSRWYNINIEFKDEEVKSFRFTATFKQKSIVQVLEALRLSRNFKYISNENGITISK